MRIDRFIAKKLQMSSRTARHEILAGKVTANRAVLTDWSIEVCRFDEIWYEGDQIQAATSRVHLMLNKPVGVVSATTDTEHQTVIDLIDHPQSASLHLAGRLDRSSSGLILLTNDGRWSERLMHPTQKVAKVYRVETRTPIPASAVRAFERGFHFASEGIVTQPANLEILNAHLARVTIHEGRYHQIKRMFHRVDGIRLKSLHRESIGRIQLPQDLDSGAWRELRADEIEFD